MPLASLPSHFPDTTTATDRQNDAAINGEIAPRNVDQPSRLHLCPYQYNLTPHQGVCFARRPP